MAPSKGRPQRLSSMGGSPPIIIASSKRSRQSIGRWRPREKLLAALCNWRSRAPPGKCSIGTSSAVAPLPLELVEYSDHRFDHRN
eukprot:923697-Pyramimonas_sp.AAC.1